MTRAILLIDDDPAILDVLERFFARRGWTVLRASSGEEGLELLSERSVDLVLQDLGLPGTDGIDLLRSIRAREPDTPVIILTGRGDASLAVRAMHAGAENFLEKPPDLEHLGILAERVHEKGRLRRENRMLGEERGGSTGLQRLEDSPALRPLAGQIRAVARSESTVLIQGETGTGKGWLARLIHSLSARSEGPFTEINCAGLAPSLLESELFGHEKGAFTGAVASKEGLFAAADGGVLFLDEIGDLDPSLQPKLLKAIESSSIRPVGGTREVEVDVRILAATNRTLEEEIAEGRFREDLYYRLAVFPLHLPPLRERGPTQVVQLAYDLLRGLTERMGHGPYRISPAALEILAAHSWPGNVREMRNVLERGLINGRDAVELRPEHLTLGLEGSTPPREGFDPALRLAEVERRHILSALEHHEGNRSKAARSLGIGRRTLYDKLERYEKE